MFPAVIDPEWRTLERWRLKEHARQWTSVGFRIDHQGVIRHIHPGGSSTETEARTMASMIRAPLKTSRSTTSATEGTSGRWRRSDIGLAWESWFS